jgi:dipeptidyl aminopeptidase/acylaminoacyl peptidase
MEKIMTKTEEKRTFEPLDELRYSTIQQAEVSPNGEYIVYTLRQVNVEKDEDFTSLWLYDLQAGKAHQLTFNKKTDVNPAWSPDGKIIAFRSDRGETAQIYLLPVDGGEARQLTDMKQGVHGGPEWSPDGTKIAFTAGPDEEPPDPSKPYRVTRFVYRFDGIGYLDEAVQNIYTIPIEGGEPRQLTDDAHIDRDLRWSPDGSEILFLSSFDPDSPKLFYAKIRSVNMDGDVEVVLDFDWGGMIFADWTPDGKGIVFAGMSAEKPEPMGSKVDLWVLDRTSGKIECRTNGLKTGLGYGEPRFIGEKRVLANVPRAGMGEIYAFSLAGEEIIEPIVQGKRGAQLVGLSEKNIFFINSTSENPNELCVTDLDGSNERQLTQVNSEWLKEIRLPKVERLLFKNDEGIEIEGWITIPIEGEAPFPTILYIHGGPHGAYGYDFRSDFQMLAGAGYAVLFTNPRGSRGYGDEFSTVLSGNWGVMDYKDLMAGVDHVIAEGISDPDRLGVCGLSYGGYSTTFAVGQTDRFKAAVAENPITDLVSRYGTADMGPWGSLSEIGGKPHEIPEVYRRSSPITYAHKCTTPTLLVQGEHDYRCPAGQSEQFYTTLKANGCIAEMLRFPNMSHIGAINGPIEVRVAQNDALLDWMDRYVLGKTSEE